MPKLSQVIQNFESNLPLALQEPWDHSGLNLGNASKNITGVLFAYDICKEVIKEAKKRKCQLIVSHHPFRMNSKVSIDLNTDEGQIIELAIKNGIALYSAHTNHDSSKDSLNFHYLNKLKLSQIQPLAPAHNQVFKLVVYVPQSHTSQVMEALFAGGAGSIGDYNECSFRSEGIGSFKGGVDTNPNYGKAGQREEIAEDRLEVVITDYNLSTAIKAMHKEHPYEEVAYDLIPINNKVSNLGLGAIGNAIKPFSKTELIKTCKTLFKTKNIRFVNGGHKKFSRIGICTGSGASFIDKAIHKKLDVLITGDVKYHQAIHAKRNDLSIIDVGHFYSERDSIKILKEIFEASCGNTLKYHSYTKLADAFDFL